jgi:hypothetical protein
MAFKEIITVYSESQYKTDKYTLWESTELLNVQECVTCYHWTLLGLNFAENCWPIEYMFYELILQMYIFHMFVIYRWQQILYLPLNTVLYFIL